MPFRGPTRAYPGVSGNVAPPDLHPATARSAQGAPPGVLHRLRPLLAHPLLTPLRVAFQPRDEQGRPVGRLDEIAAYHRRSARAGEAEPISDRVRDDLDLDAVFGAVDHCTSAVGQQVLYDMLNRPLSDAMVLGERDRLIRHLDAAPELRARLRRALEGLRQRNAYALHNLFTAELPARPRLYLLFPALTLAALLCVALAFVHPIALVALLGIVVLNMTVQVFYRPGVHHLVAPLAAMRRLLTAAEEVAALGEDELGPIPSGLRAHLDRLRWIRRSSAHLALELPAGGGAAAEVIQSAIGYANLLFLLDVNAFVFSLERIRARRKDLRAVFEALGTLDALAAVADWRRQLPRWCSPELMDRAPHLLAEGVYHPLVPAAVPNDLRLVGPVLITGSNMAGKTTFLRATGLAALLGQTIATCCAARWQAPPVAVASLIARRDDVLGGKSYFLVEAEVVKELLDRSGGQTRQLFLIDEIFRGTNTRERVAASAAVLEHLARGDDLCLVSTHDLELLAMLGDRWEFMHFRESVDNGVVTFDYRIRPGTSSAPNALRILAATGFPEVVVERAFEAYRDERHDGPQPTTNPTREFS